MCRRKIDVSITFQYSNKIYKCMRAKRRCIFQNKDFITRLPTEPEK